MFLEVWLNDFEWGRGVRQKLFLGRAMPFHSVACRVLRAIFFSPRNVTRALRTETSAAPYSPLQPLTRNLRSASEPRRVRESPR